MPRTQEKSAQDLPLFQHANAQSSSEPAAAPARRALTVTELTQALKGVVEPAFGEVWVKGEISNYRPAASGHVYFSLKDAGAMISAAAFGWERRQTRARFELKDGLEVICHGKVSIYPPRGTYQVVVDSIEPVGAGALQLAFEQLKEKLQKEGLFAPARKIPLPRFPKTVAVVTSPSGAALRDILTVLKRRAPQIQVWVVPAVVQGDQAPAQIIRALDMAERAAGVDVILLARGGGSLEDLWCFNDEALARKIAELKRPVISAVGHEIDFTIADFVADLRAPTPSAGAEVLSQGWVELSGVVGEISMRLVRVMKRDLAVRAQALAHLAARLVNPRDRLREHMQRLDEVLERLRLAVGRLLDRRRGVLAELSGRLHALSPLQVMERGFTLVADPENSGRIVKSVHDLRTGQKLDLRFHDGARAVEVLPESP